MDDVVHQSLACRHFTASFPPGFGHDPCCDATEPRCNHLAGRRFSEKHRLQFIVRHPTGIGHLVGVGVNFQVGFHDENVIEFAFNPRFIHSCSVTHFGHEHHVVHVQVLRVDAQFLFHFSHGGSLHTKGVVHLQFVFFMKGVRAAGVGPNARERDFVFGAFLQQQALLAVKHQQTECSVELAGTAMCLHF